MDKNNHGFARLTAGLPAPWAVSLAWLLERMGLSSIGPGVRLAPFMVSRDVTLTGSTAQSSTLRLGAVGVVTRLSGRFVSSAAADDSSQITIGIQVPSSRQWLLGDVEGGYNFAHLAESSVSEPVALPWGIGSTDEIVQTWTPAALAGTATVSLGLHGFYVLGVG